MRLVSIVDDDESLRRSVRNLLTSVAETLQVKLPTVKSRVHRARLFLRTRLAECVGQTPEVN